MLQVVCVDCGKNFFKSPSKVNPRNYCTMKCYKQTLVKELREKGEPFKYQKGHKKNKPSHYRKLAILLKDEGHPSWKGEKVGYRGLHQWIRRNKGKPIVCSQCGLKSKKPRTIQWANVDGLYRRNLNDFIALCVSCHKLYDLSMQAIRDAQSATG